MTELTVAGFNAAPDIAQSDYLNTDLQAHIQIADLTICAEHVYILPYGHATVTCDPALTFDTFVVYAEADETLLITEMHLFSDADLTLPTPSPAPGKLTLILSSSQ